MLFLTEIGVSSYKETVPAVFPDYFSYNLKVLMISVINIDHSYQQRWDSTLYFELVNSCNRLYNDTFLHPRKMIKNDFSENNQYDAH